jgi:hypothetical protein
MAEVEYLHVCDSAFMAEGGKHCIIGIFDVINALNFPAAHPTLTIAMRLRGQAHEVVPLKIELGRPNGNVIASVPAAEITVGPDGSAFVNMNMVGTQFPEPGRYTVKVSSGGRTLASHSLHLRKMQVPPQAAPQGTPEKLH